MSRVRRVSAKALSAVALGVFCFCLSPRLCRADDDEVRTLLFSGRDIWRNGAFAYGGLLFAPGGFEQDGFLLKVLLSGGLYRYNSDFLGTRVIGVENTIQIMPGFRIKRGDVELKFFFGPDFEFHRQWPYDPLNSLRGHDFGLRMAFDLWYEPSENTMAVAEGSFSSIATSHSIRAAYGWRIIDDQFYCGPEAAYFGSDGYRHFRFGVHFTGLKTANAQWSIAGGWARDSDKQSSPYLRLGLLQKM
jgi:hypothetical protein